MTPTRAILLFLLLLTALRLALVGHIELSPDEAYYQMWSDRLDWGYYSKGPGVAAIIRAGTNLFGPTEFGVRCFAPILSLGTSLVLFFFARRLYSAAVGAWLALLLNVTPLFTAGSILMTIDAPSVFFWSVAMFACWLALERERTAATRLAWWCITGFAIGLGFLAKYTNAMELLCVVLALLAVPRWRIEFRRPGFYLMLLIAVVVGSPPAFWNASHAWITLSHLHNRGRLGTAFDRPFAEFGKFLGAHLVVYSPLVFIGLIIAIGWAWKRAGWRFPFSKSSTANSFGTAGIEAEPVRFLLAFGLPLVVMYTLLAFKTAGEPNWTAPGFLSLSLLGTALWYERARQHRGLAVYAVATLAVGLVLSAGLLDTDFIRAIGIPMEYRRDPSARLLGWRATAKAVEHFRAEEERELGAPVFVIANRYQLAAELNFYFQARRPESTGHPAVYMPESQTLDTQFSFWPRYEQVAVTQAPPAPGDQPPRNAEEEFRGLEPSPFMGRSALFITDDDRPRDLPGSIEDGFEQCATVAKFEIRRNGHTLRTLRVYACFNYRGLEL